MPKDWSHALVTAAFKKGSKADPLNYRPISLTCILCKVMEHIFLSNLWVHYKAHNIINPFQHGFQAALSCETQLIEAAEDWARSIEAKKQVDLALLDFSKAFDKVPHQRLLAKLDYYGVRGKNPKWVSAFLSGRTQSVSVNGTVSHPLPVTSGVPQGSVLGPVLFLTFINDISQNITSSIRLFADDAVIYREISSPAKHVLFQKDLDTLSEWANSWQMHFNVSKCYFMSISTKRDLSYFDYTMNNSKLTRVPSHKYLGVTVDGRLSWSEHITKVSAKASQTLSLIKRTLYPCKPEVKANAYKTLVRPKLEYAAQVWSPHSSKGIHKIERVQRAAARFVLNDHRRTSSVTSMLERLNWPSLETRRMHQQLCLFYKIVHGLVNIKLPAHVKPITQHTRNSHQLKFIQIQCRTDIYAYSFYPRVIRMWNSLPPCAIVAPSLPSFQAEIGKVNIQPPAYIARL